MKKIALLLALVLVLGMATTAYAAEPRLLNIMPGLSFSGTTAECSVVVTADYATDEIDVVIKLWRGSTCLRTWYASGEGYVFWDDTAAVNKGTTYKLTADVTVNNYTHPRVYISGTC